MSNFQPPQNQVKWLILGKNIVYVINGILKILYDL